MGALWADIAEHAPRLAWQLASALVILALFWLGALVVRRAVNALFRLSPKRQRDIGELLASAAYGLALAIGIITALGTLGIEVSGFVAGLGLTGLTIGFALRDVLSNALAGMIVLYYRPFGIGDRIMVMGNEGRVETINLRFTILEAKDRRVLIPNSVLLTNPVVLLRTQPDRPANP